MLRHLLPAMAVLGTAVLLFESAGASDRKVRIQVVDEDSGSSLEQVAVTLRSRRGRPNAKFRTTDGSGLADFGRFPDGDFEIAACRPDYIFSGWKAWSELTASDQTGNRVIPLKRSSTRQSCTYGNQRQGKSTGRNTRAR